MQLKGSVDTIPPLHRDDQDNQDDALIFWVGETPVSRRKVRSETGLTRNVISCRNSCRRPHKS